MKMILLISALVLLSSCSTTPTIVHNRGNDPQVAIDYYKQEKHSIQNEVERIVKSNRINNGELTLEWSVDEKGRVLTAKVINDSVNNQELSSLLISHLKGLTFPKTPMFMTSTVVYTYRFGAQ